MYTHTHVHVHAHTHTHMYTHTHTHTCTYTHTHTRFTFTGASFDWTIMATVTASEGCVCTGMYIPCGEGIMSTCQSLELVTNLIHAFVWEYSTYLCTHSQLINSMQYAHDNT